MPEKSKEKPFIIGGGLDSTLPNSKIITCVKCGNKTTVSGGNVQRMKKANVLCPDCGSKLLAKGIGTDKSTQIIFPPKEEIEKLISHIMGKKELQDEFKKNLIQKTFFCKKCGTEIGHVLSGGHFLFNKTTVGTKSPLASDELNQLELVIGFRRKQDEKQDEKEKKPEFGRMVS